MNAVGLGAVESTRARVLAGFALAVLAAVGLDRLLERPTRVVRVAFALAAIAAAAIVAAMALASLGQALTAIEGSERFDSLVWPVASSLVLLAVAVAVLLAGRFGTPWTRRWRVGLAAVLLGLQSAFLVAAGVGLNSYSTVFLPTNTHLTALQREVGQGLVGLDGRVLDTPRVWNLLGLYPNINVAYQLREFAGHDPVLPSSYFSAFPSPAAYRLSRSSVIVPDISSVAEARSYGIGWLLVARGLPLPAGSVPVAQVASERLVKVPGAERFFFAPGGGPDAVVSSVATSDRSFSLKVHAPSSSLLVLGITDVPGWHVSANGRPLEVRRYGGVMMAAVVPAGTTTVSVSYLPGRFELGLVLAALAIVGLAAFAIVVGMRSRAARRTVG